MGKDIARVEAIWTVDERGYLISPSGSQVARLTPSAVFLYDKRTKTDWALTLEQLAFFMSMVSPKTGT